MGPALVRGGGGVRAEPSEMRVFKKICVRRALVRGWGGVKRGRAEGKGRAKQNEWFRKDLPRVLARGWGGVKRGRAEGNGRAKRN